MKGITARFAVVLACACLLSLTAVLMIVAGANQTAIEPAAVEQLVHFAESVEAGNGELTSSDALSISFLADDEITSTNLLKTPIDEPNQVQLLTRTGSGKRMALVSIDRDEATKLIRRFDTRLVYSLLAVLCIFALTAVVLSWPIVSRIKRQQQTITKLAGGDLSARVDVGNNDALGKLSQRINTMAQRIEALLNNNEWLLRTVSHEMRTPISRMHFSLQLLQEDSETSDNDNEWQSRFQHRLDSLRSDMLELDELLGELLTFSRLQSNDSTGRNEEELFLDELLRQSIEQFSDSWPKIGIDSAGLTCAKILGDSGLLKRAFDNVVANACRFARSKVVLGISTTQGIATITVADDGPGIRAKDRERVFEPFVQVGSPELPRTGAGLGLAIVKKIVELHAGDIRFEETADRLNCCRIQLPGA